MPTLIRDVLIACEEAERLASELEPGTQEHALAVNAAARLRGLYDKLTADLGAGTSDDAYWAALAELRRERPARD